MPFSLAPKLAHSRARRFWFVGLASLSAVIIGSGVARAQETGDEIIVTGSLLPTDEADRRASATQILGTQTFEQIGATRIADITETLTINTGAQNNPDSFTQGFTTGTSNINLRGLGVGSTLVLVNGRRQVRNASPTNDGIGFVDTASLIPLIAVDRVEILKNGASPIYGSDAIAGVVNFIAREDFEGARLSGTYLTHQSEGRYDEINLQALAGAQFGRLSLLGAVSYLDRSALTTAERRLSRPEDDLSVLGNPAAFFGVPGFSAATPVLDPGCRAAGGLPQPAGPADPDTTGIGFCGFDFGDFFNLVPREERILSFARASLPLSQTVAVSIEAGFADTSSVRGNSPSFPVLQLDNAIIPGTDSGIAANPFNPFPGGPTLTFFGRPSGVGGEISLNRNDSRTWRVMGKADGTLARGRWEIALTRARNDFTLRTEDTVLDRFQCALAGFHDIAGLPGLPDTDCSTANSALTLFDRTRPATGTFFNPFSSALGTAPNSPGLLDYLNEFQIRDYESVLTVADGLFTQEIFALPAGPVRVAVGGQYRRNRLSQTVDPVSAIDGFAFLIGGRAFSGTQDVIAVFGEAEIPLAPWADLQAAVRHERYGDAEGGSTTDPRIGLALRPTNTLTLLGNFSRSFRAPSVFQQFGESTVLQQVSDPFNGNAFVAVRSLVTETDGVLIARALQPETATSLTAGARWRPVSELSLELDYFNFDVDNVIVRTNAQAIIDADPFDPAILRAPAPDGRGPILQVINGFENASSIRTAGLDFAARLALPLGTGTLSPSVNGTYLLSYRLDDPLAGAVNGLGRRNFTNFGSPAPQLRLNGMIVWESGPHTASLTVRHIGGYRDDQNALRPIGSDTRLDLYYAMDVGAMMGRSAPLTATIGVRNATGTRAPQVFTNGGYDSRVHDPRGARVFLGLSTEF